MNNLNLNENIKYLFPINYIEDFKKESNLAPV